MDDEKRRPDTEEDPAHDPGESDDWASEGGALTEGPATDPEDSDDPPDSGS